MEFFESGRCPVCRVRFRSQRVCPRCGADLAVLMRLGARSYQLRQQAREALSRGSFGEAQTCASLAQSLCPTEAGGNILRVSRLVQACPGPPAGGGGGLPGWGTR